MHKLKEKFKIGLK